MDKSGNTSMTPTDVRNRFNKILSDADKFSKGETIVTLSPMTNPMVSDEEINKLLKIEK